MERDSWWVLVNVAVWAVSIGYGEGQLVGTGECGAMGCIERLWRGTVGGYWRMWRYGLYRAAMERDSWWAMVNVAVCVVSSGYGERHLVGTGEYGGMGCIERLWR